MKIKDEVITNGRAVFYTVLWPSFRQAALNLGYALALHGSMASDMDMIAVAWAEDAKPVEDLIKAISDCIDGTEWRNSHFTSGQVKPHGRICYTISIFSDFYIDLSIMAPTAFRVLKPLTEIEDRHCLKVAEILGGSDHLSIDSKIFQVRELFSKYHNGVTNISGYNWYKAIRYLEDNLYQIE